MPWLVEGRISGTKGNLMAYIARIPGVRSLSKFGKAINMIVGLVIQDKTLL